MLWRLARAGAPDGVRHQRQVSRRAGEERLHARRSNVDLAALRTILSTGSPLLPESFDYVYRDIKSDLHLASISGGTDIVSCFALGCPTLPVYRGEIQCRGLGMAVEIFDEDGKPVRGERGELVCTAPFPSHARRFLERSGRAAVTARLISSASRECGTTATTPRSRSTAASSSTVGPTPC